MNKTLIPLDVGPSGEQVISAGARGADLLSVTSAVDTDKAVSASPQCQVALGGDRKCQLLPTSPLKVFVFCFFFCFTERQHKTEAAAQHYVRWVNRGVLSEGGCRSMRPLKGSVCGLFHGQSG